MLYFKCCIYVVTMQPVITCALVYIEETVTDESTTDDEDIDDKIGRCHWQAMLHCV